LVSRSRLYTLSGAGHLVEIGGPASSSGFDSNPEWSSDGKWLAFFHTGPADGFDVPHPSLWLAASGSDVAHEVTTRPVDEFHWSPTGDTLAYLSSTGSVSLRSAPQAGSEVRTSAVRVATNVGSFLWSPSGRGVAVVRQSGTGRAFRTSLEVVPDNGGPGTTWWQASGTECVTLASYDPTGTAIAAWADNGCDDNADGEPLELFSAGRSPVTVATSLIDMSSLDWAPDGDELAVVSPGDRTVWANGKDIEICKVAPLACHRLAIPNGTVALDPAWSASGTLYFVLASASGAFSDEGRAFYSPGWVAQWQGTHRAWALRPDTTVPRAASPSLGKVLTFDAAAKSDALLFVRDDSIYLLPHPGVVPIRVAGPLLANPAPSGYYGLMDWAALFSWSDANEPSEVPSQASAELPAELEQVPGGPFVKGH
jgi:dipeptidyl aminopeptidase/acylaminoacyl peptidase